MTTTVEPRPSSSAAVRAGASAGASAAAPASAAASAAESFAPDAVAAEVVPPDAVAPVPMPVPVPVPMPVSVPVPVPVLAPTRGLRRWRLALAERRRRREDDAAWIRRAAGVDEPGARPRPSWPARVDGPTGVTTAAASSGGPGPVPGGADPVVPDAWWEAVAERELPARAARPLRPARPARASDEVEAALTRLLVLPPDLGGGAGAPDGHPWAGGAPDGPTLPEVLGGPATGARITFPHVPSGPVRAVPASSVRDSSGAPSVRSVPSSAPDADLEALGPVALTVRRPAPSSAPQVPPVDGSGSASPAARLVTADGRQVVVGGTTLVGRRPVLRDGVEVLCLLDPARAVSKTHLQLAVDPGGLWLTDCGSTNGTLVELAAGGRVQAVPGVRVRLHVGDEVRLGDQRLRVDAVPVA
ncbi:FHA domain-containing protein [Cellulomonas marina]|uniref:FHA domain-containing protein n=1 Tax=Cellulomonas marina TaxID=988821 RepID=A0A1I0YTP7_9CELL|nr:FHA domain-containing protein [Cellulomonas marina]GIG27525.1 hypothetical protein Cma02nite_01250 [Cellulomonas marina]SFB16367.1 FHA domain-containing protein [Cellulomonas marina]